MSVQKVDVLRDPRSNKIKSLKGHGTDRQSDNSTDRRYGKSSVTQKPAPRELSRFDVLMCEQSEGWKNKFLMKFNDLIERQEISKQHIVSSKLKYILCQIQEKRRRKQIHMKDKVEKEIKKIIERGSYYLVE